MNSGAVTGRVYDALKREVLSGTLPPGSRLDPAKLADTLASSVTPVRDALNHLIGERLVEAKPNEGFFIPGLHEPALRDRYAWNASLLRLLVDHWHGAGADPSAAKAQSGAYEPTVRALFDMVAARTGNREHAAQVASANDRLAAARHAEARILGDLDDELGMLAQAVAAHDRRATAKVVARYHRRRDRAAPLILASLYG